MTIEVSLMDAAGEKELRVQGLLTLAPALWDTPRASDALFINGVAIEPIVGAEPPELRYEAIWSTPGPAVNGVISIQPPLRAAESTCSCEMTVAMLQRAGDPEVVLPGGDDLVLTLTVPTTPPDPSPVTRSWQLRVRAPGHTITVVDQGGTPSTAITIPANWLSSFPDRFQVDLRLLQVVRTETAERAYLVAAAIDQRIVWQVSRSAQ